MNTSDWIGFTGVALLLLAFLLNLRKIVHQNSLPYLLLNTIGAGLACLASVLLAYWPFIILEGCWTMVSLYGLLQILNTKNRPV